MVPWQATCKSYHNVFLTSRTVPKEAHPLLQHIGRNHNQTRANVQLQWADPKRMGTQQEHFFNQSVSVLQTVSQTMFAFQLVATKPIRKGDEVFMDYGPEWEEAWQHHVQTWQPVPGANDYRSADEINKAWKKGEMTMDPRNQECPLIPPNVQLLCHDFFSKKSRWDSQHKKNRSLDEALESFNSHHRKQWFCEILNTTTGSIHGTTSTTKTNQEILYTVRVWEPPQKRRDHNQKNNNNKISVSTKEKESQIWTHCPHQVFHVQDKPYTTDLFLPNAFRHDLRVPDAMFPMAWRNQMALGASK